MVNQTPGQSEYQFDWQNPNRKSFEIGRVVSNTFAALREHPGKFLLVAFLGTGLPTALFSLWPLFLGVGGGINMFDPSWADEIDWEGLIGAAITAYALMIFLSILTAGLFVQMSVDALMGKPVRIRNSLKVALRLFFPLLAISIIYMFCMLVGFMLLIIPGVFIALGWMLSFHIRVVEGGSVTGALSRSWTLSQGYKRWILLSLIVFYLIAIVISIVFQVPLLFFGNPQTALLEGGSNAFWIMNALASGLAQMLVAALIYVGLAATYLEIRRVREGVDAMTVGDIFS